MEGEIRVLKPQRQTETAFAGLQIQGQTADVLLFLVSSISCAIKIFMKTFFSEGKYGYQTTYCIRPILTPKLR